MNQNNFATKKAAILAIGTEVTSGEINNSNTTNIAAKLTDLGLSCDLHLAVPDDRQLMKWALENACYNRDLVIVTGGLGPTSDDFTREVIAEFLNSELQWNESSWQAIVTRLNSVGAPLVESNKRQAYFPACATVHLNNHGTAAAFSAKRGRTLIIALPGPPKEIEGLWTDHIEAVVSKIAPSVRNEKPLRWRCLGQSESKLGELVENELHGSGFLTGYRSHMPYIDIKVWVPKSREQDFETKWRKPLESAIGPWLVGRGDDDAAKALLEKLVKKKLLIIDHATKGYITLRLFSMSADKPVNVVVITSPEDLSASKVMESDLISQIHANTITGEWTLSLKGSHISRSFSEISRYKGPANAERLQSYVGEKSLVLLTTWLNETHGA